MAITVQDVKDFCGCTKSDTIIQMYINSVQAKMGQCVEDSYDEDTANLILLNMVCHLCSLSSSGGSGKKTGQTAPNGASVSYQTSKSKSGLRSTDYGEAVFMFDNYGCWQNMFAKSFMLSTVGT